MIESVSKRAFSGSSGTYNVHALELAAEQGRRRNGFSVTVNFLDGTQHVFRTEKSAKGSALLELVYQNLELIEKDYFGLQYSEYGFTSADNKPDGMRWLDPSKSLKKQLGNSQYELYFRVKFYVSDPSKLQEENTRYHFYLQIRRDILEGRLHLPPSIALLLASYTVQAEIGDYQPDESGTDYLSEFQLLPEQVKDMENKIIELHKLHKGQSPAVAEFNFLDHVKRLDMYGVELHKAKDNTSKDIQLGVTYIGLLVFFNNVKINTFSWSKIMKISFKRKQFFVQLRREPSESYDTVLGFNMETYRSSKTLWKACVEHHTFFRLHSPKIKRKFPLSLGSKFYYSGRTEFQTVSDARSFGKRERKFVRSPSKTIIKSAPPALEDKGKTLTAPARPPRPYDNKVTSLGSKEPRQAWQDDPHLSNDDGALLERALEGPFSPGIAGRVLSYADAEEPPSPTSNGPFDTPPYSASNSPISHIEDGLITIVVFPDEDGKYGFNVTGGKRIDDPIVISKVAPNTPAARGSRPLIEGDQIVQINGHNVVNALHEDAIRLIHEARKSNNGKLVLVIRPCVHRTNGDKYEEPPYQYVPVNDVEQQISPSNALHQSMLFLADSLASGSLLTQYELLYRKQFDLTCDESSKPNNINKNRYRDISPYDATRVILNNAPSGDYINANYVDMKINGTNVVNRYIATQGPLESTTEDFWQMVHEQQSSLIVMLTTILEKGRTKCHKYWPNVGEALTLTNVTVKCVREETDDSESFVFRDFVLTDNEKKTEREITHMQYVAWPDHGVPDSPDEFLIFTERVRAARKNDPAPVIVHCSAGIGRTGVLVLMETALCLMEAGEPIYPLEITKCMRDQRAMMIQNPSQYTFVCNSVHAAYMRILEDK